MTFYKGELSTQYSIEINFSSVHPNVLTIAVWGFSALLILMHMSNQENKFLLVPLLVGDAMKV